MNGSEYCAAFTSPVLPVQITNQTSCAAIVKDMVDAIVYAVDRGARVIGPREFLERCRGIESDSRGELG